jgi:hypothetical protein
MMGIFGRDSEQDDRLDAIERQLRRLTEQVGELSIDLGVTRMELLKTRVEVGKSVKEADLDPSFGMLNESLVETRARLSESKDAADDAWATLQESSDDALATLRAGIDDAWSRLEEDA